MIEIFTDGSSRKMHGGWGWIATFKDRKLCSGKGEVNNATHQAMEIFAVIRALETFSVSDIDITIYSDSAYVVNCMNEKWYEEWGMNGWMTKKGTEVKNIDYWERLLRILNKIKSRVKFKHVKAHQTGSNKYAIYNNFADNLASKRLKR